MKLTTHKSITALKQFAVILVCVLFTYGCGKSTDDEIDPSLLTAIPSPYLEQTLIDLGIDTDNRVNGQVLKGILNNLRNCT